VSDLGEGQVAKRDRVKYNWVTLNEISKGGKNPPKQNTFPNKHWHVSNVHLQKRFKKKKRAIEKSPCLPLGPIQRILRKEGQRMFYHQPL
jgi:hypothetical protein